MPQFHGVDFVKNDTFIRTSFVESLPNISFLFAFSPTKSLATSTIFIYLADLSFEMWYRLDPEDRIYFLFLPDYQ